MGQPRVFNSLVIDEKREEEDLEPSRVKKWYGRKLLIHAMQYPTSIAPKHQQQTRTIANPNNARSYASAPYVCILIP